MPKRFMKSVHYASRGIRHAFWTQRNIKLHISAAIVVVLFGAYLKMDRFELAALIITICFVLISEMINTSIEEVVDLAAPGKNEKAMIAKDVAAGAVLFSSICAIIVGCLIFIPHLIR